MSPKKYDRIKVLLFAFILSSLFVSSTASATWYGSSDPRVGMDDAFFRTNRNLWAIGLLDLPGGGHCTATHLAPNHIITARHCFAARNVNPGDIIFRPAFVGTPNATNYSYRPSIRGKRIVFGTGHDNKINDGGTYVPGADWTIVELDPSTYSRGNPPSNSGVPDFPATFLNWPTIASNSTPNPIPSEGIDVTVFGYSGDFLGSNGLGHYNTCKLRKDAVCSTASGQRQEGLGVVLSDCSYEGGASGGPTIVNAFSNPAIMSTVGGGGSGNASTWTEENANREIGTNAWAFAPVRAKGFTATHGNGQLLGVTSGDVFFNSVAWTSLDSTDGYRSADQWRDFRDSKLFASLLLFGRLTSATTLDGRRWIFAQAENQTSKASQIWNKFETSPGVWADWQTWFPDSAMSRSVVDIEAQSAGSTAMQLYTVHTDGQIRTRRKLNTWNANWEQEKLLGTFSGSRAIAASSTGGFQQIFLIAGNDVKTSWEVSSPSSNQWSGWVSFSEGLPTLTLLDIAAGINPNGQMDVYLLAKDSNSVTSIYQRQKVSAIPGSTWRAWNRLDSDPELKGSTQIEIMTRSGATGFRPRLVVIKDGGLYTRRYNAVVATNDNWVPLYSPPKATPCP